MDKVIPTDLDGKKIFYSGIENLVRVEENLHMHLAKPEVNLSHVLNIDGGLDLEPVNPVDAYFRRNNQLAPYPDDDRRIRDYEKVMSSWSKECSKVLAIVKSIYSQAILLELRTAIAPAILNNGSRANITAVMNSVRTRWGGYTPAKSTLSRNTFESTPKFTNCSSVTAILLSLRYEIAQRVMWSDLPNNVDHRFSETEKKSLLVSLMDSWDELKILHTRLRSPVVQAAMTYDQIVAELLDAILPLQEAELMSLQMSSDRSHATTSSSLVAYGRSGSVNRFEAPKLPSKCFNCGKNSDGHRSNDCPEPMCQWCHTVWPSVKAPGYHHNSVWLAVRLAPVWLAVHLGLTIVPCTTMRQIGTAKQKNGIIITGWIYPQGQVHSDAMFLAPSMKPITCGISSDPEWHCSGPAADFVHASAYL